MRRLELVDGPVRFEGAVDLIEHQDGVQPVRLPLRDRELWHPSLRQKAEEQAGIRLAFASDTTGLELELQLLPGERASRTFDLMANGQGLATFELNDTETPQRFAVDNIPDGNNHIEVWLPVRAHHKILAVGIDDGATAEPVEDRRPRWITYGSSITHCAQCHSAARTWPAVAARVADVHLTCLGFGSECHLDQSVARMIRDMPADRISLKPGINNYNSGSFNHRSWPAAVVGFILTVRDGHPDTPLLIVSPIFGCERETVPGKSEMTLAVMRECLAEIVDKFKARGDTNIEYLDGLKLLGPDDAHYLPDQLHPNGDGYELIGRRFADLAFSRNGPFGLRSRKP